MANSTATYAGLLKLVPELQNPCQCSMQSGDMVIYLELLYRILDLVDAFVQFLCNETIVACDVI